MSKVTVIDVSYCQVGIDYKKVKDAGIEGVIIRSGYGRETSQKDCQFENHYKGAKAAGLKIGSYWYSYADSVSDAKKEAAACLACVKGKSFELPIYFDMEDSSQTVYGKTALTNMAIAFCDAIKAAGYKAGVYANLNWFNNYLNYKTLKSKYSIWLAQYNSKNDLDCDIWQNSSSGKISGISGNVDTNIVYNSDVFGKSSGTTSSTTSGTKKVAKPDVTYRVKAGGKWLPAVKNLADYAGIVGKAITDVAIKVSKGSVKYRVHVKGVGWLSWVTGYNINDELKGYAGNGKAIDAIQIIYYTPSDVKKEQGKYLKAKYRVSPVNGSYYSNQYDTETTNDQDGYSGVFGKTIDRLQIVLD
jgi:GH25 family lysozyme M1 (1,4-beta-N-acetylmuramidase)